MCSDLVSCVAQGVSSLVCNSTNGPLTDPLGVVRVEAPPAVDDGGFMGVGVVGVVDDTPPPPPYTPDPAPAPPTTASMYHIKHSRTSA